MENIKWSDLSLNEIKLKQLSLKELYENKKNLIIKLLDEMDALDKQYANGTNEINKRLNK